MQMKGMKGLSFVNIRIGLWCTAAFALLLVLISRISPRIELTKVLMFDFAMYSVSNDYISQEYIDYPCEGSGFTDVGPLESLYGAYLTDFYNATTGTISYEFQATAVCPRHSYCEDLRFFVPASEAPPESNVTISFRSKDNIYSILPVRVVQLAGQNEYPFYHYYIHASTKHMLTHVVVCHSHQDYGCQRIELIQTQFTKDPTEGPAVCVRPYWGGVDGLGDYRLLAEFFSVNRVVGIRRFLMYSPPTRARDSARIPKEVAQLIDGINQHWENTKVEVICYNPRYKAFLDVWDFAQSAQLNDCQRRASTSPIAFNIDSDEFLLPQNVLENDNAGTDFVRKPETISSLILSKQNLTPNRSYKPVPRAPRNDVEAWDFADRLALSVKEDELQFVKERLNFTHPVVCFNNMHHFYEASDNMLRQPSAFALAERAWKVGYVGFENERGKCGTVAGRAPLLEVHNVFPIEPYAQKQMRISRGLMHHYRLAGGLTGNIADSKLENLFSLQYSDTDHVLEWYRRPAWQLVQKALQNTTLISSIFPEFINGFGSCRPYCPKVWMTKAMSLKKSQSHLTKPVIPGISPVMMNSGYMHYYHGPHSVLHRLYAGKYNWWETIKNTPMTPVPMLPQTNQVQIGIRP